ncbi:MAG: 50S ribosomal protein L20 [Deltaproteobacteria bacterium RBG_16_54_18]|nr:MAG: 50S ribosomal protein L20 [Deltaproteobacteria bacterium RBG_16_54_18]
MPRVKGGTRGARTRKRILKMAEGYQGARGRLLRSARLAVERALRYAYRDRRVRKREFRRLWITRINAAARANDMTYSRFMEGLRKADITIDRKVLADIAVHDAEGFASLIQIAKKQA